MACGAWLCSMSSCARGDLVTDGLYRYVQHPQYGALFLFTFGLLVQWPTIATLLMWPVLVAAYLRLARREEAELLARFGERYAAYAAVTPRLFPRMKLLCVTARSPGERSALKENLKSV
ncbi:MAG: isoprenylcysteine carboxylmethyltransferase family protein [Armatimonadota bacterium]|nr:isoprenylcysteine carboxylmethyltransferase family protein [Armatimonadota bacterium]MDR7475135.1 isoprenylcysteine carboxylmethyltransferase family protein [Armatimonadota bacterium]